MANDHFHAEIEPYRTGELQVDDLHTLYYEECGSRDGVPILFVHGGPGAGCAALGTQGLTKYRRWRCRCRWNMWTHGAARTLLSGAAPAAQPCPQEHTT